MKSFGLIIAINCPHLEREFLLMEFIMKNITLETPASATVRLAENNQGCKY